MQEIVLTLEKVRLQHFDVKTLQGTLHLTYTTNERPNDFTKSFVFQKAEPLVKDIIQTLKTLGKVEVRPGDELVGSMFVIRLLNEDKLEEKLYNFLAKLCEKARALKRATNHKDYMQLFDDLRMQELVL